MANVKLDENVIKNLSEEDISFLEGLYFHRCLNEPLVHRFFYSGVARRQSFTHTKLTNMIQWRLLDTVDYGADYPALFLSTCGIQALQQIWGKGRGETLSSYDLKMKAQNINHQMHMNEFALEFAHLARGRVNFNYYDNKFMKPCSETMAPDAIIELDDRFLFLEMDMGNERSRHLGLKWNNYRNFLAHPSDPYTAKPITMLFIICGVSDVNRRKNAVVASIARGLLDTVSEKFEVYADSPENLLKILSQKLFDKPKTPEKDEARQTLRTIHGYAFSKAAFEKELGFSFDTYIRRMNPQRKVVVQNGRPQEFLLDFWFDGRMSVFHKIVYYDSTFHGFKNWMKRGISYLVVVPSEKMLWDLLKQGDVRAHPEVYFTTPARLKRMTAYEAVFQIDQTGAVYHFSNPSLNNRIFEKRL